MAKAKPSAPYSSDEAFAVKFGNPQSALWTASSSGDKDRVAQLLASGVHPDEAVETFDYTSLMAASFNGHVDVVKMLINAGANVNAATMFGNTALMAASAKGNTDVVELLLQRGAHPNAKIGATGFTPLMFAAQNGYDDTVRMLLCYRGDVRIANVDGKTAIDLAYYSKTRNRLLEAEAKFY